jgi:two-component system, LytTR family, sensor kinase
VSPTGPYGTRRWLWIAAVCWTLLAALYILSIGLRNLSHGVPFIASWRSVLAMMLMPAVGAALTPPVILALRRVPEDTDRRAWAVLWYVAIGVAYWLSWALILFGLAAAGLIGGPGLTLSRAIILMAYISLAAYAVMVMVYEVVRSLRRARQNELEAATLQAQLSRAQGEALRARLNPEFLFDAFATAAELMDRDARAARQVLADLGALLRASLGRNGSELASCQGEMDLLQRYLGIQRARDGDRFRVELHVEAGAARCTIPPLVVHSVVEDVLRSSAAGARGVVSLHISASRVDDDLRVRVRAAGSGVDTGSDLAADGGSGVATTRARLHAVYGDRATVTPARRSADGIEVEILIPQTEPGAA